MKKIIFLALLGIQIHASYNYEYPQSHRPRRAQKFLEEPLITDEIGSFETKAKKFSERTRTLIEDNKLLAGYLLALGGSVIAKKTTKNFLSKVVFPLIYWNTIHTAFITSLYIVNQKSDNKGTGFKELINPFKFASLKAGENILHRKISCYPILHTIKTLFNNNEEAIGNKKTQILNRVKQDLPYALAIGLGVCTPYLYNKLKKQFYKALLTYIMGHELFLFGGLLLQENNDLEKYKGFLKDHLNPTAEIEIANTVFKISPLLHFFYDLANTLAPRPSEWALDATRGLNEEKNKTAFFEIINQIKEKEEEESEGNENLKKNLFNKFFSSKRNLSEIKKIENLVDFMKENSKLKEYFEENVLKKEEIEVFINTIEHAEKKNTAVSEIIKKTEYPSLEEE